MHNEWSHFFLYAKDWYQRSKDPMDDLTKIYDFHMGHSYGSRSDVSRLIFTITFPYIKNGNSFATFLFDCFKKNYCTYMDSTTINRIVRRCLVVLSLQKIDDIPGGLCEPDYNILPRPE
jgi:hypothetical protein